jgi:hypothetical protein
MAQAETQRTQDGIVAAAAVETCRARARSRISYSWDGAAKSSETDFLGTGFGDRFEALRGGSGLFEEGVR